MGSRQLTGWWFVLSFGAVAVAFLVAALAYFRATEQVDLDAKIIAESAAPRIQLLAASRANLWEVHSLLSRQTEHCLAKTPVDLAATDEAQAKLHALIDKYRALGPLPGDPEGQVGILAALGELDRLIERAESVLQKSDCADAHELMEDELVPKLEMTSALFMQSIEFDARRSATAGEAITQARKKARDLAILFIVVALLITASAAVAGSWALRRLQRVQDERAAELEQFAARVAHDIRSPLTATLLSLESVKRKGETSAAVERATRSVRRVEQIVQALYDFARARMTPDTVTVLDVGEVVRDVLESIQPEAEAEHLVLRSTVPPGTRVATSAGALSSILQNLVRNAVRHTAGRASFVEVSLEAGPESVELRVRDDGPGIPPEQAQLIFQPRVRLRPESVEGLGLGLATVKRLTECLGGSCGVDSMPGEGATFWVRLPSRNALT